MDPRLRRLLMLGAATILLAIVACDAAEPGAQLNGEQDLDSIEPAALGIEEELRVVATTNIVGDVVGQIGRDRIALTTLMGIGVDPHSYVAAPADAAAVHDAHIVFASGAGLDSFLDDLLRNAGGSAVVVYLSEGLALRDTAGVSQAPGADPHQEIDPHVWFDVQNVLVWTQTIEQALSQLDPPGSTAYAERAAAYASELEALDSWIADQITTIPESNRKLVTNHPAFGYLATRYGLEQVGAIYPISPSGAPSARDIAELEDAIRQFSVPAVFTESTVSSQLASQVAKDTGVKMVPLYSGSLGGPGSGATTYIDLMRYNVQAIVDSLR